MRRRTLLNTSNDGDGRKMIGNYEVVDLGLSNGLLFATCNVGANTETDYGDYYMYGGGSQKYDSGSFYPGTENPLPSSADTATQVMGEGWRMPTYAELRDLINKTNYTWITNFNGSGIAGGKFTSKTNPNAYVFFPVAGAYINGSLGYRGSVGFVWSSTPNNSSEAYIFRFDSQYGNRGSYYRNGGFSVRGVHAAV
jgi:uncharacterized protein (TIGR02145 family)